MEFGILGEESGILMATDAAILACPGTC